MRPAKDITLLNVIEAVDGPIAGNARAGTIPGRWRGGCERSLTWSVAAGLIDPGWYCRVRTEACRRPPGQAFD
jgi:hypothetical protein